MKGLSIPLTLTRPNLPTLSATKYAEDYKTRTVVKFHVSVKMYVFVVVPKVDTVKNPSDYDSQI